MVVRCECIIQEEYDFCIIYLFSSFVLVRKWKHYRYLVQTEECLVVSRVGCLIEASHTYGKIFDNNIR